MVKYLQILKRLFCFVVSISFLAACSPKLQVAPAVKAITANHRIVAILPFKIILNLNEKQQAVITENDKAALKRTLAVDLQKKMYAMMQAYAVKHPLSATIQNADETLNKLSEKNIRFGELEDADKSNVIKILGVDAVIEPQMILSQEGTAYSLLLPVPVIGLITHDEYNLNIDLKVALKDSFVAEIPFWGYKSNNWYQAANKIKKDKVAASNNFLLPLFMNVDDLFKKFIKEIPYRKN